ncbi:MAG TPA: entericidin A/B family lipoprotein [Gammaproteobacteria bacterium]|nr:entericidin A/B family lipoprotein [Gammaproteobacteria bacterium]
MLLALVVSSFLLTACNTIEGAGKDIEKAGDAVQDAAD